MSIVHADFTIERQYDCTPAQAFSAFADPELKGRWFAVPADWENRAWELDFRVGGGELNRGAPPGRPVHTFRSRYHDIVPDERIVFAYDLLVDDRLMSVSLTTVELSPVEGGTRLLFTEQGAFFDGLDDPAEREHGTGLLLDALGDFLAAEPAR
ncbi:MAG: SRPBCC family protein [Actinobacteria bacterium]|nr:SRPBCC family protein [Actinomycetota bacterium]